MLVDGLHVDHLRLILGTSMGCMQSFVWGETYPNFSDALAPFACLPVELAGRNRMWRYMAMQMIRNDPAWKNGDYTTEPVEGLRGANDLIIIAGSAPLPMQKRFPTRVLAEGYVDRTLDSMIAHTDANDFLYYVNASRNYNPEPKLSTITAPVLWINSADDFINPPELGIAAEDGYQDASCQVHPYSAFGGDPRTRHPHAGGHLEGLPGCVSCGDGEQVTASIQAECVKRVTASGNQILMSIQQVGFRPVSQRMQHRKMP